MPQLWKMNKDQIFHLGPVWGSILAGGILGLWAWQYWGSAEGFIWGKPVGKTTVPKPIEKPKTKAGEKNPDSVYANPDEDEQQLNGKKHTSTTK